MTPAGQGIASGVPQHVRVGLEPQLGLDARPFHHAGEPGSGERRSPLGGEDKRGLGFLVPLQPPERPQFVAEDRVGARGALLDSPDVQGGRFEVYLLPPQVNQLGRS